MLDGLAFLPLVDVADGMVHLRHSMPSGDGLDELITLVDYFDSTYVTGSVRRIQHPLDNNELPRIRLRRIPPLFAPELWNVHEVTLAGTDRTNNQCESWNNGFSSLVGHSHPPLWSSIEALQQDAALASNTLVLNARG